jgi:hypothetical protein
MKRIIFVCIFILALAGEAFAVASSVSWISYRYVSNSKQEGIEVYATYTCDSANGSFTTTPFYETEQTEALGTILDLRGYYLYQIVHDVGATGVTDNTDLEVLEHSSTGRDILGGAGTNFMDNADATPLANTSPWRDGVAAPMPVYGHLYLKISNNVVNSATGTLIFKFIKP